MRRITSLLLICSCVLLLSITNVPARAQGGRPGCIHDNSDWWSQLRADESSNIAAQKREPAKSNFTILGVNLSDDDPLAKATVKLGKAQLVERGDDSTGRHQICYTSLNDHPKIHLIFERGEVTDSFYLFADGPDWSGSNFCVKSNLLTENASVA